MRFVIYFRNSRWLPEVRQYWRGEGPDYWTLERGLAESVDKCRADRLIGDDWKNPAWSAAIERIDHAPAQG